MEYYFSGGGILGVWRVANEEVARSGQGRLVSHAYPGQCTGWPQLLEELQPAAPVKTLLDSGAFTAWTKGEDVSRDALAAQFEALAASPHIDLRLINLDRIPGRKGVDPTEAELAQAMEESEENFAWLNERFPGRVLPVYHQGEPQAYLDRLAEESDYICISPRNDLHETLRVDWSQKVHARLERTGTQTHGLATTGFTMMRSVPWTSVDSAAWIMNTAYGAVFVPKDGKALRTLSISAESNDRKEDGAHLDTLLPADRDVVLSLIEAHAYDLHLLQSSQTHRAAWNVRMVADLLKAHEVKHVYQPGLLD
jgi:hypothetical protein